MKYAIVDIETTGGNASRDKITEVAIYVHDGNKIVDSFTSLINPERNIPHHITRITGIDNEMVEDAPKFYEVAKQIVEVMDETIFVAHNVSFDYSFIRQEFKSLGFNFTKEHLCTVKLSRKLLPGLNSYSLGKLCNQLNIVIENRHRAAGDALATVKLFEMLLERNKQTDVFPQFLSNEHLSFRFPPGFDRTIVDRLPETCGVYYMHNDSGRIIYVGKSNNIRTRVLSHFSNKQSKKALEFRNAIADVTYEITGDEMIALLLESEQIKKLQPFFNHAQRRTSTNYNIISRTDENGYMQLHIESEETDCIPIYTSGSFNQASQIIERLVDKFGLCKKLCNLYEINGACFNYSVRLCKGACVQEESAELYNQKVQKAIASLNFKHTNFMILGQGRTPTEKSIVQIEKGKYLGYGFFDTEFTVGTVEELKDFIKTKADNRDIQRIIRQSLRKIPASRIIVY